MQMVERMVEEGWNGWVVVVERGYWVIGFIGGRKGSDKGWRSCCVRTGGAGAHASGSYEMRGEEGGLRYHRAYLYAQLKQQTLRSF